MNMLERTLCKIGLINLVTIKSIISRDVIRERLNEIMDTPFHIHDKKRKRLFRGEVLDDGFLFRMKKDFLGLSQRPEGLVKVFGKFEVNNGRVNIIVKIVVQRREYLAICIMVFVLITGIFIPFTRNDFQYGSIIFLIIVLLLFLLRRYSILKNGVSRVSRIVNFELSKVVKQDAID